jgi:hypothetical protein
MRRREKLRSEKKPTKTNKSSIFVDAKTPVDNKASERRFTLPPASCERGTAFSDDPFRPRSAAWRQSGA